MPQIYAAPLVVARERGYFSEAGLDVRLVRHVGWGAVRDGLTFGELDAAQGLAGFPLISELGRDWFGEPLVSLLTLGLGGGVIVISRELADAGVTNAAELVRWVVAHRAGPPLMLAHTFSCSPHRYVLREFLAGAGVDPDRDVRLSVVAPPLLVEQLAKGYIAGFCAGEPLGVLAARDSAGVVLARGEDIVPAHPAQALVVGRRWLERHDGPGGVAHALVRAIVNAAAWCQASENRRELARLLCRYEYLNLEPDLLDAALAAGGRSLAPAALFPSKMHAAWMLLQMVRWGEVSAGAAVATIAERCCETAPYRAAAAGLGIETPADDFPPMPLARGGVLTRGTLEPADRKVAM